MPLDPNIILQGAAPLQQQPNMLAQYASVQQIQQNRLAMHAQQQAMMLGAVKQKAAELDLSQQQLAATQQSQISQLLAQNKGDVAATITQARAAGNPLADTLEKNKNAADELIAKQRQAAASAQKDEVETNLKKVSQAADALGTLKDTSDELKPIYYQTLRQQAIAAKMPGAEQLPLTWNPQAAQMVDALHGQALTAKDRIEAGLKRQQEAEQARHNTTEEQLTAARDYNTNQNESLNRQSLNQYRGAELGIRGKELGLQGARLGLEQSKFKQEFGDATQGMSQGNLVLAQKLAAGELNPSMLSRLPGKQAIMSAAVQINPNWTPQLYETKKDFKTGKGADDLQRLQTAYEHAQRFIDNSGHMGTLESATSGMNLTGNQRKMSSDANLLSGEVGRLVTGGVVPEGELHQIQNNLKSSSASVRRDAANELMQLVSGKVAGLKKRYENGTGMQFDNSLLTPEVQKATQPAQAAPKGVPSVGAMFNGEKVLKVTKVQ
jgi:hypothetical protein